MALKHTQVRYEPTAPWTGKGPGKDRERSVRMFLITDSIDNTMNGMIHGVKACTGKGP